MTNGGSQEDPVLTAVRLVLNLSRPGEVWTHELIETKARSVLTMLGGMYPGDPLPDVAEVVRQVEGLVNVWQPEGTSLIDTRGHVEWLTESKNTVTWRFWDRYRRYLEDVDLKPREVIRRLDDVTDGILRKLESPTRDGEWDRRGLVVGQVQSGKTSNYTGLICKAADAGYKLILVLAGIHNSLRSQTQLRLDEGFLGFDTQFLQRIDEDDNHHFIGVGALPGFDRIKAASLTNSSEYGDFRDARARSLALPIGDYPVVLVVKKHAGILENIHDWVTGVNGVPGPDGTKKVLDVPLLVIDDEADNASIDTSRPRPTETDPTAVNRNIRRLLNSFAKSAYVGYTATPFANLYVSAYDGHSMFGDDLFPRSFIDLLRPPSNYFGPERVFGLGATPPLPVHRVVDNHTDWMPVKHDKAWSPPATLPSSLERALRSFVLTCAARRARGGATVHNSMLVHVSRFQDVQVLVGRQLQEHLSVIHDRLRYGDGDRAVSVEDELRELWESDFVPTSDRFDLPAARRITWNQVRPELLEAVSRIEMRVMNGRAKDALEYYERRKEGLSVVAVGGNKLSRGLTLEGLSVSYYLRASKMYDTLMQMGRWFGYRHGYEDLCRLYTTTDLRDWYREITAASDELGAELEEMAAQRATPLEYGLRVRQSAAGLSITAANKMRSARRVRLSFSGGIPETTTFDVRPRTLQANREALTELCARADAVAGVVPAGTPRGLWHSVPSAEVVRFLDRYRGDEKNVRARADLIAGYIRACNREGELRMWDVLLVSSRDPGARSDDVGGRAVRLTRRDLLSGVTSDEIDERCREIAAARRYVIRRVLSPSDERRNLEPEQVERALKATIGRWRDDPRDRKQPEVPNGPLLRAQRRDDQPLLVLYLLDNQRYAPVIPEPMVGYAVSFPVSAVEMTVEYAVNEVWSQLQLQDIDDDPDDDDD